LGFGCDSKYCGDCDDGRTLVARNACRYHVALDKFAEMNPGVKAPGDKV
jgi:hypothetical protein